LAWKFWLEKMDMSRIRFWGNFQRVLLVKCMGIPMWFVTNSTKAKKPTAYKFDKQKDEILLGEDLEVE
jgi:hypothetical protein